LALAFYVLGKVEHPRQVREANEPELLAINNALNEVCHGPELIEEPEFHTRMGVERREAEALLNQINRLLPD
jgi:hypothetical protein